VRQAELDNLRSPVSYLDAIPSRPSAHLQAALRTPAGYAKALRITIRHRDWDEGYHVAGRYECLALALKLAELVRNRRRAGIETIHIHAQFAHDPAAVGLLTNVLTGIPWSFTGHARDLWQVADAALAERVREARFALTCSAAAATHLQELLPPPLRERVRLVRHGVDVATFRPAAESRPNHGAAQIVSVGRLVEKKGFEDLIEACRSLRERGREFRLTIFGEGPLRGRLQEQIDARGLAANVTLAGACSRQELLPQLQAADLFALTPYLAEDRDVDGIPNAVVEAMSCGIPVVATAAGGVPEIVLDGTNGRLVPPRDVPAIAAALDELLNDPARRDEFGRAARRTVLDGFDARAGADELAALFRTTLEASR
jgi:glycosyltransferase involved in cell wall biosynthesis